MSVLQSTLKLTLLDAVSQRARAINRSLDGLTKHTSGMLAMSRSLAAFGLTYFGATQGWDATYNAATKAQASLAEIGIKAGLTTTQLDAMHRRLTAISPKANQFTSELIKGVDVMASMGLTASQAMGSIEAIARTATATGASIEDLSKASVSAIQNLGVAPEEITKALDAMALAGNAGAFELRDMAQYMPQLSASAKTLGIDGVDGVADLAAALQVARRGTGDASTAATNLSDFMAKIVTPQTIKNFKKFGVNVTAELKKAHKNGISPIEHFIQLLDKHTQGGKGELLTQIFGDKQTLDFIRPMIADFKDYIRIREESERATGTVDSAFAKRMQTNVEKVKSLKLAIDNLGTAIGANMLTPVGDFAKHMSDILNTLDQRVTVLDRVETALQGFFHGLGFDGGKAFTDALKSVETFLFGVKDGSKSADEMGGIFAKFEGYGKTIKQFGLDIEETVGKIEKFFGLKPGTAKNTIAEIGSWGLTLGVASIGIGIAAGAISGLAKALLKLSGVSALIGGAKGLAALFGAISGGKVPKLPTAPAVVTKTPPATSGLPPALLAWGARLTLWTGAAVALFEALDSVPHAGTESASKNDPEYFAKREAYRRQFGEVQFEGGRHRAGLGAGPTTPYEGAITNWPAGFRPMSGLENHDGKRRDDANIGGGPPIRTILDSIKGLFSTSTAPVGTKSVTIDQASIAAMVTPRGTQDVRVTNRDRPQVHVHLGGVSITGITDLASASSKAASQLGEKVRGAVESSFTD